MLTVLDEFTRECLGILVARSITATDVIAFLKGLFGGGVQILFGVEYVPAGGGA